ncbi:PAS domain S-box-containing protein [Dehalogenimonas formicexedens]|uniref:histidine kinase n=1 Tax=Dehalogenimonas formicexedens TaxID=1839801 RepID=A0A1P8F8L9_9CHLR|nr:MASE3 domain-containing protein [Dehalogenimonas formicexedens]APV44752.1 PAS domain S-box-containing protein [Dehalogenimonas formicexedens]
MLAPETKTATISVRMLIAGVLAFAGFYILSRADYLLFHSIVELLGVAITFSIFVIAWNARRFMSNDYLLFIGVGFLFVSILSAMHTLSYRGMGVFIGFEPTNLAAQFWIAARYLQSFTLILAPLFIHRRLNSNLAFTVFGIATALIIMSILVWQVFPAAFVTGSGLTAFKIISEYAISGILLGAALLLRRHRAKFGLNVVSYLTAAMLVNIAAEMAFTLYTDAYGFLNAVGHFLILISIYFIYKAIIETGLSRPFDLMFHQLKLNEERFEERANELQRFELLSNNSRDIILMIRADDGHIVEANTAATAAYGYTRNELLALKIGDLRAEGDQNIISWQMAEANDTGIMFETIHRRRDGREFPVEVSSRGATIAGTRLLLSVVRDITDRKRTEQALKQSEAKLRSQLDYILSPEGDLGEQELLAILDLPVVQGMMDDLYEVTRLGFAIIDLKGKVLVGTGWQDICVEFHRKNPITCANCIESDLALTQGVKRGEFKTYKCKNNMWDIVTPLYVGDRHVANVFTGQFFFEDEQPDAELFAKQANRFGFDKSAYLAALNRAPRHSREKVAALMDFFTRFSSMVSELGYSNLKLAKANADQQQAAEALKISEERFNKAFKASPAASAITRVDDGTYIDVNENYERLMGYSRDELVGRKTTDFDIYLHPEQRSEIVRLMSETGRVRDFELTLRKKNGQLLDTLSSLEIINLGEQKLFLSTIIDITDRKKAESAVKAAAEEWQATFDSINDIIMLLDPNHRIIRANQAFTETFKIPAEQAVGKFCYEIVHATAHPPAFCPHRRTINCGTEAKEEFLEPNLGIYIEATTLPIIDNSGKCTGSVHIVKNIHERKLAEAEREKLHRQIDEQRRLLQNTLDQLPAGVVIRDVGGTLVMANSQFSVIFGEPPGNENTFDLNRSFHRDGKKYLAGEWPMNRTIATGKAIDNEEVDIVRGDASRATISASTSPIRNDAGQIIAYVGVFRDITDSKRAEGAIQELNATLERRVEQRTRELESAYADLSEQLKLRAKAEESLRSLSSRLLSIQEEERRTIARELHDQTGQSLTVLKLMFGRADRMAPEEMKPILKDTGNLIADIIKQVRSLSLSLRPGILDDLGLVPAMEWLFKQLQSQADLLVHFEHGEISGLSTEMNTVIYRITQEALTNIMRHAGVKEAWIQMSVADRGLYLRIEDHGRGFDTTVSNPSTGLSAMRERAALLGGSYNLESSPGRGTVINVVLPLRNPASDSG